MPDEAVTLTRIGKPPSRTKNTDSAARPAVRETGMTVGFDAAAGAPRHNQRPATPPSTIAPIWAADEVLNKMISAAITAMVARSRSGHNVRAMPQIAWATI